MKTNENLCMICLRNDVFFECNEVIFEFFGPSYKDCYQQFIQLQCNEDEVVTQMLCLECGNCLREAYQLAEKCITSANTQTNENQCRICLKESTFFDGTEAIFEFYGPSYSDCYFRYMKSLEEENNRNQTFCMDCGNGLRNIHQLVEKARKKVAYNEPSVKYEIEVISVSDNTDLNVPCVNVELNSSNSQQELDEFLSEFLILGNTKEVEIQNNETQDLVNLHIINETIKNPTLEKTTKNKPIEKRKPLMCSYCSKIFYSRNHFTKHEETHMDRERTETCTICGLKFYTAKCLKNHLTVHDENRERKFKCEYCSKAFYSCGGLNCHRRKHLDEWWQCPVCPKKYSRQYELNRHMRTHEAVPITEDEWNAIMKKQVNQYKNCQICGKQVNRYNWESHNAKHLNKPVVQCNICSKSYFSRLTLCRHLQKSHGVYKTEYEKYIIRLNNKFKPRYSNLMKKQNIVID